MAERASIYLFNVRSTDQTELTMVTPPDIGQNRKCIYGAVVIVVLHMIISAKSMSLGKTNVLNESKEIVEYDNGNFNITDDRPTKTVAKFKTEIENIPIITTVIENKQTLLVI